jgi:hypothetical protein
VVFGLGQALSRVNRLLQASRELFIAGGSRRCTQARQQDRQEQEEAAPDTGAALDHLMTFVRAEGN